MFVSFRRWVCYWLDASDYFDLSARQPIFLSTC